VKPVPRQNIQPAIARGFTLREVLVALVIVGLGMMAVFDQLNQMLTSAARLRDKTFATWIAEDRITELQVTGEFPKVGERSDEVEMARALWAYTIKISGIPEMDFRRVDVTVAFADSPDYVLAELAGFIGPPQQRANPDQGDAGDADAGIGTGFGEGWAPLDGYAE
jgi:general secretion pathway protein I